tara:strand:+ start:813 stop:2438 length:1626 start_codon:yes stop_codon:yes gene_type:complete
MTSLLSLSSTQSTKILNDGLWILTENGQLQVSCSRFYSELGLELDNADFFRWQLFIHNEDKTSYLAAGLHRFYSRNHGDRLVVRYRVQTSDDSYCWVEEMSVMFEGTRSKYLVGTLRNLTPHLSREQYFFELTLLDKKLGLQCKDELKNDLGTRVGAVSLFTICFGGLQSSLNSYSRVCDIDLDDLINACCLVFNDYSCKLYRISTETFAVLIAADFTEEQVSKLTGHFITVLKRTQDRSVYLGSYVSRDLKQSASSIIWCSSQACEYAFSKQCQNWATYSSLIRDETTKSLYIGSHLEEAILTGDITVSYQPIVSTFDQSLESFEALARWHTQQYGYISPLEFIPIAEQKGLIDLLGEYVLMDACSFIKRYNDRWSSNLKINVNVTWTQLINPNFPERAKLIVELSGLKPDQVVLELADLDMLEDEPLASDHLMQLKQSGFVLAMDDFGIGHNSMVRFLKYKFDQIKIDKGLVLFSTEDEKTFSYIEFIGSFCSTYGIEFTVVGIESEKCFNNCSNIDDCSIQGYYISTPLTKMVALDFI